MRLTFLHGISLFFIFTRVFGELRVRGSGIEHIDRLDVGIVFFIEVVNEGKLPLALGTRMNNCCENITPDDIDCEHIQLIGGDMGVLHPHGATNVTLVWPSLYLHERKGECSVAITYACVNNQTSEIETKVRFDTSVSSHRVPPVLEGYYEPIVVRKCPSVDLDPLDHCRPINCHVKYSGKRNFYNRKLQRCQPVPICVADLTKELPNLAYVPVSNTCRDLENAVNEMEIRALRHGEAEPAWASEPAPRMMNMYCHHGYNDNATGFCICEEGWTSHSLKNVEPSTEYIHMCNVQKSRFPNLHGHPIEILLIVIAAFLGIFVVFLCCAMTFMVRGFIPSNPRVDCGQQTAEFAYFGGSTKSLSCSSSTNFNKRRRQVENQSSSTSYPEMR